MIIDNISNNSKQVLDSDGLGRVPEFCAISRNFCCNTIKNKINQFNFLYTKFREIAQQTRDSKVPWWNGFIKIKLKKGLFLIFSTMKLLRFINPFFGYLLNPTDRHVTCSCVHEIPGLETLQNDYSYVVTV